MRATILLTGAGGFIGRAIARNFGARGVRVIEVGSLARNSADRSSSEPAESLDLLASDRWTLSDVIARRGITHCVHAAWYTNHGDYLVSDVNQRWLEAGRCLVDACAEHGVRLTALGTCFEYDLTHVGDNLDEATSTIAPGTLYAECKVALSEYMATKLPSGAWARIFYVYGPGDRAGRLVPHFLSQVAKGHAAEPRFGALRRDFIHVDDLGEQIAGVARSGHAGAINCATGCAPTLNVIAAAAASAMGHPDLVTTNALLDPAQAPVIRASISRIEGLLGSVPARPIERGLTDTVQAERS